MNEFWDEVSTRFGDEVLDWDVFRVGDLEDQLAAHLQIHEGQPPFWAEIERKTTAYFRAISFEEEAVKEGTPLFQFMPIPCYREVVRDLSEGLNMDIPPWSRMDRRWLGEGILPPHGKACYLRISLHEYILAVAAYNYRNLFATGPISSRLGLQILIRGVLHETSGLDFFKLNATTPLQ